MLSIKFLASSRISMIFLLLGLAICPALHANTPLDSSYQHVSQGRQGVEIR
jgi:hypothetical protein